MAMARITRNRAHGLKALLVVLAILVASAVYAQDAGWQQEITAWRAQRAVELQKPDGWLALAGLEWLEAGDTSFGAAKDNKIHLPPSGPAHLGVLHLDGETVTLKPPAGGFPAGFLIAGKPVQAQTLNTDAAHDKNDPPLTAPTLHMSLIHRPHL